MTFRKSIQSLLPLLFLCTLSLVQARQSGPSQPELEVLFHSGTAALYQENQLDSLITWQERILLHIDKPTIAEDSPLFFKAYTLTGPNRVRATLSKVIKLELLNRSKEILAVQYHKIENGMAEGEFLIPNKLNNGVYTLRAYTRWMQNYGESFYYTQKLVLGIEKTEQDDMYAMDGLKIDFYPEGGHLVANVTNRLLFAAKDTYGNLISLQGHIIGVSGEKVAPVTAFENGIMSAIYTPRVEEEYRFICSNYNHNMYKLPKSVDEGYGLSVNRVY